MSPAKPSDYILLFEVYRRGLILGLISVSEVIAWADKIICQEEESDYFFIELALCSNVNGLVELLNEQINQSESPVAVRVIFSLIYYKLATAAISLEQACIMIGQHEHHQLLTRFESGRIYGLDYYDDFGYPFDECDMMAETLEYLAYYKDFTLNNFADWPQINADLETEFKAEELKFDAEYEQKSLDEQKKRKQQNVIFHAALYGVAAISFVVVLTTYQLLEAQIAISKFRADLYQFSLLFAVFFCCYYIVKGIDWLLRTVFPGYRR